MSERNFWDQWIESRSNINFEHRPLITAACFAAKTKTNPSRRVKPDLLARHTRSRNHGTAAAALLSVAARFRSTFGYLSMYLNSFSCILFYGAMDVEHGGGKGRKEDETSKDTCTEARQSTEIERSCNKASRQKRSIG